MGATVVISVNVGTMEDTRKVSASLLGIIGGTVDAMMLASTRRGMAASDIVINPDLTAFNSMDWRKVIGMIDAGYQAADALKDKLLPLALDEAAWQRYVAARNAKRKTQLPSAATMVVTGASASDEKRIRQLIEPRLGQAIDPEVIKRDIESLSGLDAYQTIEWGLDDATGAPRLTIRAVPKPHAPPFLMFSTNLQNTTTEDFSFQLAGRYLNYDVLVPGSELRLDVAVGSVPSIAGEFLQHVGSTPVFVTVAGAARSQRFNFVSDDTVVAQYDQSDRFGQIGVGLELGNDSEVRVGMLLGRTEANVRVGNPDLPSLAGKESEVWGRWRYDTLDSVVVPSGGVRIDVGMRHVLDFPDVPSTFQTTRTNADLTQMDATLSSFWSVRTKRDRLFVSSGLGTSFDGEPLPTDQFQLGTPFRLGAFDFGEKRGDHYLAVTGGYLRGLGRMPDFLGGPIFAGAWLENGSAWDHADDAAFYQNVGAGLIIETLVGPVMAATSFGFDGNKRFYVSVGRLFP
ncbi:MAG TPA: BamA/TamA family outer membrane protein, partial [Vicinamibacterales bacterium]